MSWIDVKDRLPEIGMFVLVSAPACHGGAIIAVIDDVDNNFWYDPSVDGYLELKHGQHWQPLPEPPK